MRILVTGATGFAGRWLVAELASAGHEAIAAPSSAALDITDRAAVVDLVERAGPDAIAHLAGMSYGPDARRDPDRAMAVNEGGAHSIVRAATAAAVPVMLVSSAEVYGVPDPRDLPLSESAPLATDQPYGRSKLAAERIAVDASAGGPPIVIVRPFNHTGPGQRPEFVVPALARRIVAARKAGRGTITAGNVDVRRDFSDVRDVVRGYRLILEHLGRTRTPVGARPDVYNIASGTAVSIRSIALRFAELVGIAIQIEIDPALVRPTDSPEIRGDASRLREALGWRVAIPWDETLRDVLAEIEENPASPG